MSRVEDERPQRVIQAESVSPAVEQPPSLPKWDDEALESFLNKAGEYGTDFVVEAAPYLSHDERDNYDLYAGDPASSQSRAQLSGLVNTVLNRLGITPSTEGKQRLEQAQDTTTLSRAFEAIIDNNAEQVARRVFAPMAAELRADVPKAGAAMIERAEIFSHFMLESFANNHTTAQLWEKIDPEMRQECRKILRAAEQHVRECLNSDNPACVATALKAIGEDMHTALECVKHLEGGLQDALHATSNEDNAVDDALPYSCSVGALTKDEQEVARTILEPLQAVEAVLTYARDAALAMEAAQTQQPAASTEKSR